MLAYGGEATLPTAGGRPTGPGIQADARRLEDAEASHAARLLAAKPPIGSPPEPA